jgi:hypothetical protein
MIVVISVILGALLGYRQAHKRGGNGFDKAQFAAVYAILFGLAGLFATLMIDRML